MATLVLGSILSPSWNRQGYYDYGWIVLPLAVFFFLRRRAEKIPRPSLLNPFLKALLLLCLLALIPLKLINEVDLFWRQPLWISAGLVLIIWHLLIARAEGWPTSCYCLPATLFCLTAVPLPSSLESLMIHKLTDQVVDIGHYSLLLAGYPVEVVGNLFIANGAMVDVAEGCSGIRSIQSSIMAGLALGEIFRTSMGKRILVVIIALILAFVGNAARIFILGQLAFEKGVEAIDSAHDTIGFFALFLVYGGLTLLTWLMTRKDRPAGKLIKKTTQQHA